jgi:hypothetical protein
MTYDVIERRQTIKFPSHLPELFFSPISKVYLKCSETYCKIRHTYFNWSKRNRLSEHRPQWFKLFSDMKLKFSCRQIWRWKIEMFLHPLNFVLEIWYSFRISPNWYACCEDIPASKTTRFPTFQQYCLLIVIRLLSVRMWVHLNWLDLKILTIRTYTHIFYVLVSFSCIIIFGRKNLFKNII